MSLKKWLRGRRWKLNNQSATEQKFSDCLSKHGIKFKRNLPMKLNSGRWVFLDFIFPESDLIVELDGREHVEEDDLKRDMAVVEVLKNCKVIRFKNKQIKKRIEDVMEMVLPQVEASYASLPYPEEFEIQDAHLRQIAMHG